MPTLERAIAIGAEALLGRVDQNGYPYCLHPIRVMLRLEAEADRIVAVLHDVVADCPEWSLNRLRSEGFTEEVISALDALTRRQGESYSEFTRRLGQNRTGRHVKLLRLSDRLPEMTEYERAIAAL